MLSGYEPHFHACFMTVRSIRTGKGRPNVSAVASITEAEDVLRGDPLSPFPTGFPTIVVPNDDELPGLNFDLSSSRVVKDFALAICPAHDIFACKNRAGCCHSAQNREAKETGQQLLACAVHFSFPIDV